MSGIHARRIWSTIRRSGTNSWRHDLGRLIGGRMDLGLKGKKAVVTGGSKGIGRAIADTFASEGADVALCARNAADGAALKSWIADAAKALGGIDSLVCNGSALAVGDSAETWEKSFKTDMMHT